MAHDFESRVERARLAFTQVTVEAEGEHGISDDGILDVIARWTTDTCLHWECTSDTCCDHQALAVLVWAQVDEWLKLSGLS